ncbi:hypothetical protein YASMINEVIRUS_72 [Yasminevirus sp. GU-2018]|uniref:Aspartyl/asparaginy/proline hydroxylase domain-containing protein n=1 Tax=Yasminevirus sp. GU-2018 TaxID=2420051 RepID=A0A5K0U6N3_9VIRU|nr:hypothetical protein YASMINEVIRUS_72 [Yasminevirus sp. GU-2018]
MDRTKKPFFNTSNNISHNMSNRHLDLLSTDDADPNLLSTQKTWSNILIIVLTVIVVCFVVNLLRSIVSPKKTDKMIEHDRQPVNYHGTSTNNSSDDQSKQCIVQNELYPEMRDVMKNKEVILDELVDVIGSGIWSTWGKSYDEKALQKVPRFSEMTTDEKMKHLDSNKTIIGRDHSWKLFGLILEREPIKENILKCNRTYNLIKDIPGLINAGFSCLEPHSKTPYHNDQDERFYRVHIPLIVPNVPEGAIGLDVYNNKGEITKLNWHNDYFVFDDTCYHQAYNDTDYHRVVLLLDVARRP